MATATAPSSERYRIAEALMAWFERGHRKMPWRESKDPYAIWISEVMLQQTRVETVIPYYLRWMASFPTVEALAAAPLEQVLEHWSGLGYYRRARALHRAAGQVLELFRGKLPRTVAELEELDGIGPYTAGAISSIAFDEPVPAIDGNGERVLSRMFLLADRKRAWDVAADLVPRTGPSRFNQALMELGATVCTPTPRCTACPVHLHCQAAKQNLVGAYPPCKPRREIPTVELSTLLLLRHGKLLVRKRPERGIWAGLWEFPTEPARQNESARAAAQRWLDQSKLSAELEPAPKIAFDHVLTHRKMRFSVFCGQAQTADLPATAKWLRRADILSAAISAATRRIAEQLEQEPAFMDAAWHAQRP